MISQKTTHLSVDDRKRISSIILLKLAITVLLTQAASAQMYSQLASFDGQNGSYPYGGVVRDLQGNLYGTTSQGGPLQFGTVFKLDTAGALSTLYSFDGSGLGAGPKSGLILDPQGNLYGTTVAGGSEFGGDVFRVSPTGQGAILHSFTGPPSDGDSPYSALVRDSAGNLYGTTAYGGAYSQYGWGTIFKVDSAGNETVLYSFMRGNDGGQPYAGLVADNAGNLYGTAELGGVSLYGTIFKLDSAGTFTVLLPLNIVVGYDIATNLTLDANGNLYGGTFYGGTYGFGTVFELNRKGRYRVLYNFTGGADGSRAAGGLLFHRGILYGTTILGGQNGYGTVFEVNMSGEEKVLYSFGSSTYDGQVPSSGLVQDETGTLYGTTQSGGLYGYGTVYSIKP